MRFNLDELNEGTFFPFEDGDSEGVSLRIANDRTMREIRKKTVKKVEKFVMGQFVKDEVFDEDKYDEMLWDYVITDWCVKTPDGEDIPCTKENKVKLIQGNPQFMLFVDKCLDKLRSLKKNPVKPAE